MIIFNISVEVRGYELDLPLQGDVCVRAIVTAERGICQYLGKISCTNRCTVIIKTITSMLDFKFKTHR